MATPHEGVEVAVKEFVTVASTFGLKVSFQKTKFTVAGKRSYKHRHSSIPYWLRDYRTVGEFPYTGSVVMATARVDGDIKKRIQQGSKAFGALRQAILNEKSLTIN